MHNGEWMVRLGGSLCDQRGISCYLNVAECFCEQFGQWVRVWRELCCTYGRHRCPSAWIISSETDDDDWPSISNGKRVPPCALEHQPI